MTEKTIYSDIAIANPKQKSRLENVEAIYQSINNILFTQKGERPFLRDFGSDIRKLLFEPMNDATAFAILTEVVHSIRRWEHRIFLIQGQCSVTPIYEENKYEVVVVFGIKRIPKAEPHYMTGDLVRRKAA